MWSTPLALLVQLLFDGLDRVFVPQGLAAKTMSMSDIARLRERPIRYAKALQHVALESIAFTAKPVTRFNPGRVRESHRLEDCGSCNIVLAVGV